MTAPDASPAPAAPPRPEQPGLDGLPEMDRERVREALRFFHGLEEQPPVSDELKRRVASELGATREDDGAS